MERKPVVEDVDDVLLWPWTIGALGRERVEIAIDGRQFRFHDLPFIEGLLQVLVEDVDGLAKLFRILLDGKMLRGQRLLDADVVERVAADGIDFWGKKNPLHLS